MGYRDPEWKAGTDFMKVRAFIIGALVGPIILALLGLILALGGFIPVGATHEDSGVTQWLLHSTYQQSVARKATSVSVPDTLDQRDQVLEGARSFQQMCSGCHTPPGEKATVTSQGLNPPPPELEELLENRTPAEASVVLRDGVRMSGMPAFGPTHSEKQLWALVAFLNRMAGAPAKAYKSLIEQAEREKVPAGHDGHDHAH
jgi:mono/diheme cytochrome c family protein